MNQGNPKEVTPTPMSWRKFPDLPSVASGPLYYYVGAGLSMEAGLAGWPEMACIVWRHRTQYELDTSVDACPRFDQKEEIEKLLDAFVMEKSDGAQLLGRNDGESPIARRALGRAALLNMLLRYRAPRLYLVEKEKGVVAKEEPQRLRPGLAPTAEDLTVQSLLWRSRCHGVFTTNYDLFLEDAHVLFQHGVALRTYRYTAAMIRYALSNPRFVLHLHGDINDIATMEFNPSHAWNQGGLSGNGHGEALKSVYGAALASGHMIYLGCGFSDETITRLYASAVHTNAQNHLRVALVPSSEIEDHSIRWKNFPDIQFLTYCQWSEVREFAEKVSSLRSEVEFDWPPSEARDLYRQVFRASRSAELSQNYSTDPWTCTAVETEQQS